MTNEGLEKKITDDDVYTLFKGVQESVKKSPNATPKKLELKFEEATTEYEEHSIRLLI